MRHLKAPLVPGPRAANQSGLCPPLWAGRGQADSKVLQLLVVLVACEGQACVGHAQTVLTGGSDLVQQLMVFLAELNRLAGPKMDTCPCARVS